MALAAVAGAHWRQLPAVHAASSKAVPATTTLHRAERAFARRAPAAAPKADLTPLLHRLAAALPRLHGADHRQAVRLLARPTDGAADPQGNGWTVPEARNSPVCSAHFCVHWVDSGPDAPDLTSSKPGGVPDWVYTVDDTAENVYSVENGQLGWAPPKSDGTAGGGPAPGLTDIYLADIGGEGIYGYTAPDPGQQITDSDHSQFAYLVLDNDFSKEQFPTYSTPVTPLQVTVAHEYNHVLQFNYDSLQDTWMFESTAVWAEGKVYEPAHDYLQYLPGWASLSTLPITAFNSKDSNDRRNVKVYGSAVWNKWLDARYGPDVVRNAWEDSMRTNPQSFGPAAYDAAIRQHGGKGFGDEFDRFTVATAEWQASNSGFPEGSLYPDVDRTSQLAVNRSPATIKLDHTSYALVDVPVTGRRLKLSVVAPKGDAAALGLVGLSGGSPGGTATREIHELPDGGSGTTVLPAGAGPSRITAVLINSDVSQKGYSSSAADWVFTKNGQRFYVYVSTDFTAPKVRHAKVSGRRVSVTFSERMRTVPSKSVELLAPGGHRVRVRVKFNQGSRHAVLTPTRRLKPGTRYRVRVTSGATDLALNRIRKKPLRSFRAR